MICHVALVQKTSIEWVQSMTFLESQAETVIIGTSMLNISEGLIFSVSGTLNPGVMVATPVS